MFTVGNVCVILQPKRGNGAYRLCDTWWCVAEQVDVRMYQHRNTVENRHEQAKNQRSIAMLFGPLMPSISLTCAGVPLGWQLIKR